MSSSNTETNKAHVVVVERDKDDLDINEFGFAESDKHCICVYSKEANIFTLFIGGGLFILGIFIYNGGVIFLGILLMLISAVCFASSIGLEERRAKREHRVLRRSSGSKHDIHDFVDIEAQQKMKPVCIATPHHVFKKQLSAQGGEYRRPSMDTVTSTETAPHEQAPAHHGSEISTQTTPPKDEQKVAVDMVEIHISSGESSPVKPNTATTATAADGDNTNNV